MDTLAPESTRQNLRSQRLNLLTNEPHQRLESLVKSKEPLRSLFQSVAMWCSAGGMLVLGPDLSLCMLSVSTLLRQ